MYVKSNIVHKRRNDLTLDNDHIDSLFIEIIQTDQRNVIIGVIYKPPNFNSNEFIDSLCTTLSKVESEQKDCYLLGDYNFDLLKHSTHGDTEKLSSTLNTSCYRPLITKPTRVTAHSCTCIDNIFSSVLSEPILILYTDISDHFPIFSIAQRKVKSTVQKHPSMTTRPRINVSSLIDDLKSQDFSDVMHTNDVNLSYDRFMNSTFCQTNVRNIL